MMKVIHLTTIIMMVVGLFATNTLQQCPAPRPSGSGGCPSDTTTTSSPGTGGCPIITTSSPVCQNTGSGCPCSNSPGNGAGSDSCAYPAICANPPASSDVPADSDSPYYDQVISASLYVPGLDNACTTMFPMNNSTSLLVHSKVYDDGSVEIDIKSVYAFTGFTGVYRGESLMGSSGISTCIFNDFILGEPQVECEGNYVFYRCYLFGDCVDTYKGTDTMTAYSIYNMYNISDRCKDVLISFMKSKNLNSPDFFKMPNNLPHQCVTNVGGLECFRADSVEQGTGLSIP